VDSLLAETIERMPNSAWKWSKRIGLLCLAASGASVASCPLAARLGERPSVAQKLAKPERIGDRIVGALYRAQTGVIMASLRLFDGLILSWLPNP
jgi:hypothetical protein